MKKKVILLLVLAAVFLCAWFLYTQYSSVPVSYTVFVDDLENKVIEEATIKSDRITYKKNGEKTLYSTLNPSSPTIKEELLLSGVRVEDEREDTFDAVLNTAINIIFLAIIIYGLYKLVSYSTKTFRVVKKTGVTFSDIAGMKDIKEEILSSVKDIKDGSSIRQIKGIILEGPPGNGKTLFARALAQECGIKFIATKGADFQGAVMGLGAFKVKMLFNKARRHRPCIIFIDEFDSIGERRNYAGSGIDKENNRILTTLLNELDGFVPQSKILVIAATNSYDSLDPALIRPGRFDLKFTIPNPDEETRRELVKLYLKETPLSDGLTEDVLVSLFSSQSSAAIETVLNEARSLMVRRGKNSIDRALLFEAAEKTALKIKKH